MTFGPHHALGPDWLDPQTLLDRLGDWALWGAAAVVFAECGLLIGFFLPGDSLLFTVGLLIGQGSVKQPLWLACVVLTAMAFLGNVVGYEIGRRVGPAIFRRPDSKLFRQEYVDKTVAFFDKYGARAIVLARFVPIVRTFCPIVAGAGQMEYGTFVRFNVVGGFLWGVGVTLLGYFLGNVPLIADNIELALLMVVAVSLIPIAIEVIKSRRAKKAHAAG